MTVEKEQRTQYPFLCLAFKKVPVAERRSDFNPRAHPCLYLRYDPRHKAYAMLTIPNLYLTYSIEVDFVPQAYPLRVTNYLSNQIDTFLRPTAEDEAFRVIHGPSNLMRPARAAAPALDQSALITPSSDPVAVRSSARLHHPTSVVAGLESGDFVTCVDHARV
jgi:hypothetical protein